MFRLNRNTIIAIVTSALAITVLAGFSYWLLKPETTPTLRMASGGPGGTYYAFSTALSEIVNSYSKKIRIEVVESSGSNDNADRLQKGITELGLLQSDTVVGKNVSIAARLFPEMFHLIARADSNIKSVSDLKGRRLALPPKTSGSTALFSTLRNHYELGEDAIEVQYGSLNEGMQSLKEGKADALFVVMAMGNDKIKHIIKSQDLELISIDQAPAISLYHPALKSGKIPVGAYSGEKPIPSKPISIISVDSLLAVNKNVDAKYVKELTAILFEKRQELIRKISQGAFIAQPSDQHRLSFDIHEGAEQFFHKNDPPFLVEYAEQIGLGITVLLLLLSSVWQLRSWLSDSRKNRADHYNKDLVELSERVNTTSSREELEVIREELFKIFKLIIDDIDNDKIEEKSLQSFSFAWEVALTNLNHRQLVLNDKASAKRLNKLTAKSA
ncbi:MAG: TAXI family TRAP transporter solute-binding subunit [Methyloligellaceae bacterium]